MAFEEVTSRQTLIQSLEQAASSSLECGSSSPVANPDFVNNLLPVARRLDRLFQLPCPDAPGLRVVGARVDPSVFWDWAEDRVASATGKGLGIETALVSCLGEALEYLSRQGKPVEEGRTREETIETGETAEAAETHGGGRLSESPFLAMAGLSTTGTMPDLMTFSTRLSDGAQFAVPRNLGYQLGPPNDVLMPAVKLGTGCGVGATIGDAQLHGLLELIERDAVALWWGGGRPGKAVPNSALVEAGADALLRQLRNGKTQRRTWLVDITTDTGIPVIAALSCDKDGITITGGFAARLSRKEAMRSAVIELCQAELSIHLVLLKRRQTGVGSLNEADENHMRRCFGFKATDSALLSPVEELSCGLAERETLTSNATNPLEAKDQVGRLAGELSDQGVEVLSIDLTNDAFSIPACRVISADLQPWPAAFVSPRLASIVDAHGGGPGLNGGIDLV